MSFLNCWYMCVCERFWVFCEVCITVSMILMINCIFVKFKSSFQLHWKCFQNREIMRWFFKHHLTDYQHNSIIKLRVRWCVWKEGEGFPDWVWPKTLKWVVYSSVVPHQLMAWEVGPVYTLTVCHILWLWHGIPVWQHNDRSTTATIRHRQDMTLDVKAT